MVLYDSMMERLCGLRKGLSCEKRYGYDGSRGWPEHADYQMIFQKDAAFELGGAGKLSANLTCVTTNPRYFQGAEGGDQILVYGPELSEIAGAVDYARICEVLVEENWCASEEGTGGREADASDEDAEGHGRDAGANSDSASENTSAAYKLVQDMDFVKYHFFPKGFMLRTSGQSGREQVRVSKDALRDGISFERIGNALLSHYKKDARVLAVRVTFITAPEADYTELQREARLAADIRNSLSELQKGLPTECGSCSIREICNEVEGLRELHFGKKTTETVTPKERHARMARL